MRGEARPRWRVRVPPGVMTFLHHGGTLVCQVFIFAPSLLSERGRGRVGVPAPPPYAPVFAPAALAADRRGTVVTLGLTAASSHPWHSHSLSILETPLTMVPGSCCTPPLCPDQPMTLARP